MGWAAFSLGIILGLPIFLEFLIDGTLSMELYRWNSMKGSRYGFNDARNW